MPIFVDRRQDVEHCEGAGDGEVQQPNCEVTPRTNPIQTSGPGKEQAKRELCLPTTRAKDSRLRSQD